MKLLLKKKWADEIMGHIPDVKKENEIKDIPKSGLISIMLFSVFGVFALSQKIAEILLLLLNSS